MPPEVSNPPCPLELSIESPTSEDVILSMWDPTGLAASIASNQWTIEKESNFLISVIEHAEPKLGLVAQRQLRALLKEVAALSGMIGQRQVNTSLPTDDGGSVQIQEKVTALVSRIKQRVPINRTPFLIAQAEGPQAEGPQEASTAGGSGLPAVPLEPNGSGGGEAPPGAGAGGPVPDSSPDPPRLAGP
jgi:hypothetical protein